MIWPQYLVDPPYIEGTSKGEPESLIWLLDLRPDYSKLMHPRSQGTRVEAQDRCGPILSLDAPSGFRKGLEDLVSFRLFQGSQGG